MKIRGRSSAKNRGQATLEFLLCALVLLTVIFSTFQIIVVVYTYGAMAKAAKQGVRYAVVHGSSSTITGTTNVETAVKRYANYTGMTISVTYPEGGSAAPSKLVEVTLTYPFSFLRLGWLTPTIKASARGRIYY